MDLSEVTSQQFMEMLPYARELGMELVEVGDGMAEMRMPYDPKLSGDSGTGVVHGGVISALVDTCFGAAVLSCGKGVPATIDLRIDYMRPAAPGQPLRARAECHHIARSVTFVHARAFDGDADRPVAFAVGRFSVDAP